MSRLVEAIPRSAPAHLTAGHRKASVNNIGERAAKYVPAEVLAFYTAAIQFVSIEADRDLRLGLASTAFAVALIITPLWLGRFTTEASTKRPNQIVGTLAFLIWAYAYPAGLFIELGLHRASIAGFVLIAFTLASGFFQPKK